MGSAVLLNLTPPSGGVYAGAMQFDNAGWGSQFSVKVGDKIYAEASTGSGPGNLLAAGSVMYLGEVTDISELVVMAQQHQLA